MLIIITLLIISLSFYLFCVLAVKSFTAVFSICSCSLSAPSGSRKVVLSSTNKPEKLIFFFFYLKKEIFVFGFL